MKRLFLIPALLLLYVGSVYSQTLKGLVYDAETNEPLIGVNISFKKISGKTNGTISDADGHFELELPSGATDVIFSYIGYENTLLPVIINKGETKNSKVSMHIASTQLDNVVISAGRFEQKQSNITVSMDILKSGDIAKQVPTDLSSTLSTLPGVDINDKQPSIRGGNGWTYGVGSRSLVLVDGMSVLSSGNGVINWNVVPLENIEQVEVIKGASSVLYGSSALNGIIHVRTKRPNLVPTSTARAFVGIYDKTGGKTYEGADFSHARRIGDFDISAGINLFNDDGYREQGFNKRLRLGGNLTYHQPMQEGKLLNYGFNANFLADKYADFFLWRSPAEIYTPSSIANMGRKGNTFYIDPFLNYTNPEKNITHRLKGRFYSRRDHIIEPGEGQSISGILDAMETDRTAFGNLIGNIQDRNFTSFLPLIPPLLQGNWSGLVSAGMDLLRPIFPGASTADICDLISYGIKNGFPTSSDEINPWMQGDLKKQETTKLPADKNYTYYLDYLFYKKWDNDLQLTAGATYEHMKSVSATTGIHNSDNGAVFIQYDQRFFDRLSVSAGMRAEYYRVDDYLREAETKIFGMKIPVKPIFRAGLNYQLADYSFIRASFGQGYRYPSLTEKYARKDIGGVGVYPNPSLKAEKGINAELGFKQAYKWGNLMGFIDLAGFYTEYKDMIEFRFGFFNNSSFEMLNSIKDVMSMVQSGATPGVGAQFYNVSKARIYGTEISTTGTYQFNNHTQLSYNLGYVFIEPRDCDYKQKNEEEAQYSDPLQMKEKSNTSPYLKYRQKHTIKGIFDLQWKRLNFGSNIQWKSKTLAVDYFMVDERLKKEPEAMDYVRTLLFGYADGETLHSYWEKNNKPYCLVDLRAGVKVTQELQIQLMMNNVFNKTYSTRPMAVGAPRSFLVQANLNF